MDFFKTYAKEIISLLVPFITWMCNTALKPRARLVWATPHVFTFLIQEPLIDNEGKQISPTQTVNTASFFVVNAGKETATNVELVFNWKPHHINVWPSRHYEDRVEFDKRYIISFKSMAPGEQVGCELLSVNSELPRMINLRSDQCIAENVTMAPQQVQPRWKILLALYLMWAGLAAVFYVAILLLQFLILKTPLGYPNSLG